MDAREETDRQLDITAIVRDAITHDVLGLATFLSNAVLLTASRVVAGHSSIEIAFPSSTKVDPAEVVRVDERLGLAVLGGRS